LHILAKLFQNFGNELASGVGNTGRSGVGYKSGGFSARKAGDYFIMLATILFSAGMLGRLQNTTWRCGDFELFLREAAPVGSDFVFVDPPYDRGLIGPSLAGLTRYNLIDAQSCVIVEHSPREAPVSEGLALFDSRKYGQTIVSFLKLCR